MTSKAALFALLAIWGVGGACTLPAFAEEMAIESQDDTEGEASLADKVWVRTEEGQPLGAMAIFLSDGTLVQDSCWETHRLSAWQMVGDKSVSWSEDGVEIAADIKTLTPGELVLTLKLRGGATEDQHFAPATVPYVCKDMPKG